MSYHYIRTALTLTEISKNSWKLCLLIHVRNCITSLSATDREKHGRKGYTLLELEPLSKALFYTFLHAT